MTPLLGHVDGALPTAGEVLLVVGVLAVAGWLDRTGRARGVLPTPRRAALWTAVVVGLVAVVGPLEAAAHRRFAWHMVQHLLLLLVVAPGLVLARPDLTLLRRLPGGPRRRTALRARRLLPPWPLGPVLASVGLGAWLWVAHVPAVYAAQLGSPVVHGLEHAVWVLAGVGFWTPLLRQRPTTARRVLTPLLQLLVLMPAASILSLVLLGGPTARFAHHLDLGAAAAMADQRVGAGLMWAASTIVLLGWALLVIGTADPRDPDEDDAERWHQPVPVGSRGR